MARNSTKIVTPGAPLKGGGMGRSPLPKERMITKPGLIIPPSGYAASGVENVMSRMVLSSLNSWLRNLRFLRFSVFLKNRPGTPL